jgi:hypothetical protein
VPNRYAPENNVSVNGRLENSESHVRVSANEETLILAVEVKNRRGAATHKRKLPTAATVTQTAKVPMLARRLFDLMTDLQFAPCNSSQKPKWVSVHSARLISLVSNWSSCL